MGVMCVVMVVKQRERDVRIFDDTCMLFVKKNCSFWVWERFDPRGGQFR